MKKIGTFFLLIVGLFLANINNIQAQLISVQPLNNTLCFGDDAVFIVQVVNNLPDTSFQWQYKLLNGS
ncbi:MAG: hypothetical protein R2750_06175 [Bacteroidales bacterium]